MNAWTSSPSLSLNVNTPSSSSSAFWVGWHVASTLPRRLWDAYVAYLWSYQPRSWVGRLASTFRILAVLLVLPVVLLTLLDVTSYVIVRTLGVVDDGKACTSTSEDASRSSDARDQIGVVPVPTTSTSTSATSSSPWLHGDGVGVESTRASEGDSVSVERRTERDDDGDDVPEIAVAHTTIQRHGQIQTRTDHQDTLGASPQAYCFAAEAGLRLAGEGVFSPAVSMPPSPVTPRMPLHAFAESESEGRAPLAGQASEEIVLRRRVQIVRDDGLGHT